MNKNVTIVGGGIGGLAAALACTRAGLQVELLEQSALFGEVGAGIQMGPNVVRVLEGWGLGEQIKAVAAYPEWLQARHAHSGALLARAPLGADMVRRYGAAYATIARADLHTVLLTALCQGGLAHLRQGCEVTAVTQDSAGAQVQIAAPDEVLRSDVLVGADGLWSRVRSQVVHGGAPRVTGHLAYRAMVPQSTLPEALRSQVITAWMGPDFHVVQYPVRGGAWLNVVAVVQGPAPADPQNWDHGANAGDLRARLAGAAPALHDLVHAIEDWRLWALCDRPPLRNAAEHAQGRIALLGDAAHPMRPYLAQGAGMAIEDAAELARVLAPRGVPVAQALATYAANRWQRNARVQARSIRNGEIFHLSGPMRLGRDLSLKLLGARLMDVPWLYQGPAPR